MADLGVERDRDLECFLTFAVALAVMLFVPFVSYWPLLLLLLPARPVSRPMTGDRGRRPRR
jgi:hypothetical protein